MASGAAKTICVVEGEAKFKFCNHDGVYDWLKEQPLSEQKALDGELKFVHVNQTKQFAGQDSLVFVRQETKACWDALESCFESRHNLSIEGPPGTGKSTTAWAWARWKARQQATTVTWFHYNMRGIEKVILDGAGNRLFECREASLPLISYSQGIILVVDGVTRNKLVEISHSCTSWYKKHDRTGMFVLVSSQDTSIVPVEQDLKYRIKTHLVDTWSQSDYLLACEDPVFFAAVEKSLECPGFRQVDSEQIDDDDDANDNKKHKKDPELDESGSQIAEQLQVAEELQKAKIAARVAAKYYFAGGNARWMFEFNFAEFQKDAQMHLALVSNLTDIFYGRNPPVDHLRGAMKVNGEVKYFLISQYVVEQLAKRFPKDKFIFFDEGRGKQEPCLPWLDFRVRCWT